VAIVPITKQVFAKTRFKRNRSFHFANEDMVAPLTLHELPQAMLHVPIGFAKLQGTFMPVAIQGLSRGQNLFVAPDGRWIGKYLPMCYRFQPFALAKLDEDRQVLCCDDASDLLSPTDGEPFFDAQENRSEAVTGILSTLVQHSNNRKLTQQVCAALAEMSLISEWAVKIKDVDTDLESVLSGLFRVNEDGFNQLTAEKLAEVRRIDAFPLIYCQLLSMQHVSALGQLSQAHALVKQRAQSAGYQEDAEASFTADTTTLTFNNLDD
jgi:hypothetical protein